MSDLEDRPRHEKELALILAGLFVAQRRQVSQAVVGIKTLANIDGQIWVTLTRETADVLRPKLRDIYLASASQLPINFSQELLLNQSTFWARQQAFKLSTQLTITTATTIDIAFKRGDAAAADILATGMHNTAGGDGISVDDLMRSGDEARRAAMDDGLSKAFGFERIERIAPTETTAAAVQGQDDIIKRFEAGTGQLVRAVWHTEEDGKVCPICRPLNGTDRAVWERFEPLGPPAHVNCVLPGQSIIAPGRIEAASKASYVGRCVEIILEDGTSLTVTPNHPILTPSGRWRRAGQLRKGSYVLCASDAQRMASAIDPNNDQTPSCIEEIFASLEMSAGVLSRRVPLTTVDFHGDSVGLDGDIHVVRADGELWGTRNAAFREHINQHPFDGALAMEPALVGYGAERLFAERMTPAASSIVRGQNLRRSLLCRHGFPFKRLGSGLVSGSNARDKQAAAERPAINASLARQFVFRFAGDVTAKEIIKIRQFNETCHVYDLQIEKWQLYICNGVVVHNCRCWLDYSVDE